MLVIVLTDREEPEDPTTQVIGPFPSEAVAMEWIDQFDDHKSERFHYHITQTQTPPWKEDDNGSTL